MIERAFLLRDKKITDEEKEAVAKYYVTLDSIKEKCYSRRDQKQKETNKENGVNNG